MQQRPGRTVLTMLSIVIGVTAAVAVGLGTATTRNAYKQMFGMVTGRTTLEVDGKGGAAFENTVLEKIEKVAGVEAATPVLNRGSAITIGEDRRLRVQLLGIDPERDSKVRDYVIIEGRQVKDGDELVFEKGYAEYLGIGVGDSVKVTAKNARKPFEVVGLFKKKTGVDMGLMSMAFMPLATAQKYFIGRSTVESKNSVDMIQVVTAKNADPDKVQPMIADILHRVTLTVARSEGTNPAEVQLAESQTAKPSEAKEGVDPILQVQGEDAGDSGARLTEVVAGGPADKAGLKVGDVITEFEGDKVANFISLREKVSNRWGVQ